MRWSRGSSSALAENRAQGRRRGRTGNTLESFAAAVEAGVDAIELDVLRPQSDFAGDPDWRRADAGPAAGHGAPGGGPRLGRRRAAASPRPSTEALDAFTRPPLDGVRFDLDLKIAGREDEVVAALADRGLTSRAMVSTMEVGSLAYLRTRRRTCSAAGRCRR